MRDLSTLLRDHVEALAAPVSYDEVVVRRPRRRGGAVLAAAAVLVALALGAVLVRAPDEGERVTSGPFASSAEALRREGTGAALVRGGFALVRPEADTEQRLGDVRLFCGACPLVRVGEAVYGGGEENIFRLDPPTYAPTKIAGGNVVFSSPVADELYVATADRGAPHGNDLRRITTTGTVVGGPWRVPDGYWLTSPAVATARGVVLESPPNSNEKTFTIWDPATGAMGPLGRGTRLVDTHVDGSATVVARLTDDCRPSGYCKLAITELATARTRLVEAPGDDRGFIGGGGFSPDGTKLAAFSVRPGSDVGGTAGGRRARLVIIDVKSGRVQSVGRSTIEFGGEYGFATWAPNGKWVFFGGSGEAARLQAHRLGARDAVALDVVADYSTAAVTAPPPSVPTTSRPGDRQFGFLKAVDERRRTLTFDLAEYFSDAAADRAAEEDGAIEPGEGAPNDYYVRNRNPMLRTLRYAPDVSIHGLAHDLPTLIRRVRDPDAPFAGGEEGIRVWLTLVDGVVVDIENPYFP